MRSDRLTTRFLRHRGFSIVEIAVAIAILAFALVALLAVMPSGMGHLRSAMDTTVTSQIAQRILEDAQRTEFDTLVDRAALPPDPHGKGICAARFSFRAPRVKAPAWRYFDEQGLEITSRDPKGDIPDEVRKRIVYQVNVRIRPRAEMPTIHESRGNVAQVTVQVARNPSGRELKLEGDSQSPEHHLIVPDPKIAVFTFCGLVGRNHGR